MRDSYRTTQAASFPSYLCLRTDKPYWHLSVAPGVVVHRVTVTSETKLVGCERIQEENQYLPSKVELHTRAQAGIDGLQCIKHGFVFKGNQHVEAEV